MFEQVEVKELKNLLERVRKKNINKLLAGLKSSV